MTISVSVITPIYNTEAYLENCLQSLVSQTLADIELIWIDNGANSACRQIITKYQSKRPNIKVIHLPSNQGYSGAMNQGLQIAGGEYVGFCDSDDWVAPNYYEQLYQHATKTSSDIVYTNHILVHEGKAHSEQLVPHRILQPQAIDLNDKLSSIKNGAIWDKIYRHDLIKEHCLSFSTDQSSYYQDNIFLIQAIYWGKKLSLLEQPYYYYRQLPGSLMHDKTAVLPRLTQALSVIKDLLDFTQTHHFSDREIDELCRFMSRSLPLYQILNHKDLRNKLYTIFAQHPKFCQELQSSRTALYPTFAEKLFSISHHNNRTIFRFCGITFKKNKGVCK